MFKSASKLPTNPQELSVCRSVVSHPVVKSELQAAAGPELSWTGARAGCISALYWGGESLQICGTCIYSTSYLHEGSSGHEGKLLLSVIPCCTDKLTHTEKGRERERER